jgi:hypothetical protein
LPAERSYLRGGPRSLGENPLADHGNHCQDLFDAFGPKEKTLHANMGGHTGVPQFEETNGNRFFARHLK